MTSAGSLETSLVGFKRHLRVEVVKGEAVYVLSEGGVTALPWADAERLAPLLDGTRDLSSLRREIPSGIASEQLGAMIVRLLDAGLVVLRPPTAPGSDEKTLAYWEAIGLDPSEAVARTAVNQVQLITVGDIDAPAAMAALAALRGAGITATARPDGSGAALQDGCELSVVLCDDYLTPRLADIDALHRAANRPWLLAKPIGAQVWIGPVFGQETACWSCLAGRQWALRQAEAHLQTKLGRLGPVARPAVTVAPLAQAAMQLVVLETMKWLAGNRYAGQHAVWTFDSVTLDGRRHEVRRRPQCASCGDPGMMREQAWREVQIRSRIKVSRSGGGHRALPPEDVFERYRHLISPVTGVVKEIKQDRRGPAFFNSFRAGPNVAMGARNLESMRASLRSENGGKGITALHGKVSALCEALERHSGYFHGDEERISGSFASFAQDAVHPATCLLYDERQYAGRAAWNAAHSQLQYVCDPFDDRSIMDWTPVWSLTDQRHRLLPTGQLYFGAPGTTSVRADSNGNAAGSSIEDATLQGLLELVERDSVALWWYNRTPVPAVDLDAFGDRWVDELRTVYKELHRDVWVLDLTADLGIPTMAAVSRRTDKPAEDIMFGFGAHLDPRVALIRALTEMNQLMPAVAAARPGGGIGWTDPDAVHWWRTATTANQPYLMPDATRPARRPADFGYTPSQDLAADVATVRNRIEGAGMEVLVLDQTRPDIGLPVVKTIVPGMRGFWARFAPGRLFDTPVRLGRRNTPVAYADLNPIPLFV